LRLDEDYLLSNIQSNQYCFVILGVADTNPPSLSTTRK
jgi:hypothetical protein